MRHRAWVAALAVGLNSMAVTILDEESAPAGRVGGFEAGRYHVRGSAILASDSTTVGETSWSFTWTAPPAGTG